MSPGLAPPYTPGGGAGGVSSQQVLYGTLSEGRPVVLSFVRCVSVCLKGLVEIVPIFHTVFAHVYHYAISELCKGLYHHNGV